MTSAHDQYGWLLVRIARNDAMAMEELYCESAGKLRGFILRMVRHPQDAEEVLQDVFRQIWTSAADWNDGRGNSGAWIYTIARTRALDHLRRVRRRGSVEEMADFPLISKISNPESSCRLTSLSAVLTTALMSLPESQRELIDRAFYEGSSHAEIASETGLPVGTVKTRIRTGLIRMRQALPGYCAATLV